MNRSSGRIFERKYEMTLDLSKLTSIPIVMTIVCVILVLNVLSGVFRGFVRKISGIVAFLLAGILVTALLPTVTSWLHTTPVYGFIREQCETVGESIVKNGRPIVRFTGEKLETLLSIRRGEWEFDKIIAHAEAIQARIIDGKDRLPVECDKEKVSDLIAEVMRRAGVQ